MGMIYDRCGEVKMDNCIVSVDKKEVSEYVKKRKIIVAIQRNSRGKCKQLAILELLQLLQRYSPQYLVNGPLGDVKHAISFGLVYSYEDRNRLIKQLDGAGYTYKFYELCFDESIDGNADIKSINPFIWKGCAFSVRNLFFQDETKFRNQAADKRDFKLLCGDGIVRTVKGYRGDGSEIGKRALAVEDCRVLMNLAVNENNEKFLDPFCGAGGIVYQVKNLYDDILVYSNDVAAELEPGLTEYGAFHKVGLAEEFVSNVIFDSIATEIPFAESATNGVLKGFENIMKYISEECKIVIMVSEEQKDVIYKGLNSMNLYIGNVFNVNRKGTSVSIIIAFKNKNEQEKFKMIMERLKLIY